MFDFFRVVPKSRSVKLKTKKGVLFRNPNLAGKMIFYVSNVSIFALILYLGYLYFPLANSVFGYYQNKKSSAEVKITEEAVKESVPETIKKPEIPEKFKIDIPKISASTWVETNVSASDKEEYNSILEQGMIAHAKGTNLPGTGFGGMVYLFAHSSTQDLSSVRNNTVFYLLGEMKNGDKVFADYNGEIYEYEVYDKKIVKANDTEYLSYSDPSKEVIILQTCWPIGTNWNRLLIFGKKIEKSEES